MNTLRNKIINNYINANYPNAKIINFDEKESNLKFYTLDELKYISDDWFPLACYKDPKTNKLVYGGREKIMHTYLEGETGVGKTTRFVMQSIMALSSMKIKPSFLVVDIHGEIIENLYNHLKISGYDIKILNCNNPAKSDSYNPFSSVIDKCLEKKEITDEALKKIKKISEIMEPIESTQDPVWDQGARSYVNGIILDKFEDLIIGNIPERSLNIYNIIQNHYWIRDMTGKYNDSTRSLLSHPYYRKKGMNALSVQKIIGITNNAEKTRASYFGVAENHLDDFSQPSFYKLSSSNTIDIDSFIEKPTIIVIQTADTNIGNFLISFLVNDIYSRAVNIGIKQKNKRLPRNIHCFLDEFANTKIANGDEFVKMLTTSRKFGMYWHMILQCDAQLNQKYSQSIGDIVRANCAEIFMGSNDYTTKKRFADSCGVKTIESLSSLLTNDIPTFEVFNILTPESLNQIKDGYMYVKQNKNNLLKTYFEAFYNCDEFTPVDNLDDVYPVNDFNYEESRFTVDDFPILIGYDQYMLLTALINNNFILKDAIIEYQKDPSCMPYDIVLENLEKDGVVEVKAGEVKLLYTKNQIDVYNLRYKLGLIKKDETHMNYHLNPVTEDKKEKNNSSNNSSYYEKAEEYILELVNWYDTLNKTKTLKIINKLTIIPQDLKVAMKNLCKGKLPYDVEWIFENPETFKFVVMETFINGNNYKTMNEWISNMKEEMKILINILPLSIFELFEDGFEQMKKLNIKDIEEIKKIISSDD